MAELNWDDISKWEDDNEALVMWVVTTNCIRERMQETNQELDVKDSLVYEFCYHSRRGWEMEEIKNMFKDFVIETLKEELIRNGKL